MDRLARMRAPLAVAALVALSLVALARVGLGLSELRPSGSRAVAAARLAPNASDGSLTLLVAVLVVACFVAPAVPSSRRLAAWGAVLAALSLVATVVALALTSAEVAGWSLVWLVPEVAVPAVVGVGLLALARRPAPDEAGASATPVELQDGPEGEGRAPDEGPDPELQPGWTSDSAAGAVWRTAGEAARGAPAAGWGQAEGDDPAPGWGTGVASDPSHGWGRPPAPPAPPAPSASSETPTDR